MYVCSEREDWIKQITEITQVVFFATSPPGLWEMQKHLMKPEKAVAGLYQVMVSYVRTSHFTLNAMALFVNLIHKFDQACWSMGTISISISLDTFERYSENVEFWFLLQLHLCSDTVCYVCIHMYTCSVRIIQWQSGEWISSPGLVLTPPTCWIYLFWRGPSLNWGGQTPLNPPIIPYVKVCGI